MKSAIRKVLDLFKTKLANNGKFAALDQAIISVSNFAASILLTTLVSPTELGVYLIGFLAIYFVRAIQNGVIIQPLNTYGAGKNESDFRAYFSAAAVHQLLLALLVSVCALVLGLLLTSTGNDTLGPTVFVLWFSAFTWQIQEFLRRAFYTRGAVGNTVWISLSNMVVRLGTIWAFAQMGTISGLTGLHAIGWGGLAGSLIGLWLARGFFTKHMQNLVAVWKENWRFGRWILGASLADWIVVDFYPIMMAGLISFAATGVYQTLQNLVAPIHVLLRAIDTFVTPILARVYDQSGLGQVKRSLKLIFVLGGIPVIGLLLVVLFFTPQLLYLLKGDTYLPYADGIYLMALFYLFMFINRPLQMVFRGVRQGKQVFLANILAALSMFSVGFWLIKRWGVYGAIAGQALNAIIISIVLLIAWLRFVKRDLPESTEI